ncbi:MAG: glycerophosphodiester phosphodiesterase [Promethearchaeota archaeon]
MRGNKKNFCVIGHKGATAIAPENTLKAFKKAIELKADYIEFDIHHTLDKEIIIHHDEDTLRTTGVFKMIKDATLEELKKLNAGEGEQIPTLQELINISKGKIKLQPEIKVSGLAYDLTNILRTSNLIETSIVSCFEIVELLKVKEIEPQLKLGYLIPKVLTKLQPIKQYIKRAVANEFYAIHPYHTSVNKNLVEYTHRSGLKINVWTVNDEEIMKRLIDLGVDGIFTDDIALLNKLLGRTY